MYVSKWYPTVLMLVSWSLAACSNGFEPAPVMSSSLSSSSSSPATDCSAGQSFFAGICQPIQRSCSVANGIGSQTFSNGAYGTCVATSCNAGYNIQGGVCVVSTYNVTPSGSNVSFNPSTAQNVKSGASQVFVVSANSGYTLSTTVTGTCPIGTWSGASYTTGPTSANCTVSFTASANSVPVVNISKISNQTTTEGPTPASQATFTASVTGPGPITCQWYVNSGSGFDSIAGATSCSSYTTGLGATTYSGYQYELRATNSSGSTTSNAAAWTVNAGPYYFATASGGATSGACTRVAPCTVAYAQAKTHSLMQPVYLLAGTYHPGVIKLTSADNGAIWSGDWMTNLSYPFQTILDGQNAIEEIFWIQGGSNITIQNMMIENATHMGVCIHGGSRYQDGYHPNCTGSADTGVASNNTVQNTELYNFPTNNTEYANVGCISLDGNNPNTHILNNYCHRTGGMGIRGGMENADHNMTGLIISGNVIIDTMRSNLDGAPLYFTTFISHTELPVANVATITNNFIRDYGSSLSGTPVVTCVYFDSGNSGMTFKNNVCAPSGNMASSTTVFALELNCGKNNVVDGNIFDLGTNPNIGFVLGGNACGVPGGSTDMSGDSVSHNIVISKFSGARSIDSGNGGTSPSDIRICGTTVGSQANVIFNGLLSYNYGGGTAGSNACGKATITNQVVSNPSFNTSASEPYQLNNSSPAFNPTVGFTGIPSSWGPMVQGFKLPAPSPNSAPSYQ